MSFSYNIESGSDKDLLRLTIQDTSEDDVMFSDEELNALIKIEHGWKRAAIYCCYSLAALYASQPDSESLGISKITFAGIAQRYRDLADDLQKVLFRSIGCCGTGTKVAQVNANYQDDSIVQAAFTRRMDLTYNYNPIFLSAADVSQKLFNG